MMKWLVVSIGLLLAACASSPPGEAEARTAFALEVVEENIITTDYTALVKITHVRTTEIPLDLRKPGDDELIAVVYTAKVLQNYFGDEAGEIDYIRYIEKSEGLGNLSRKTLIVSLCKDVEGNFYLPDIGYELPAENVLLEKAQTTKTKLDKGELSLIRNGRYACSQTLYEGLGGPAK